MKRRTAALFLVYSVAETAWAGPFGFDMGKSVSSYTCEKQSPPGFYKCAPAKPHSAFESYIVEATDKHGICWIKGVGKNISDNGYGFGTKQAVDDIATQLSQVYGAKTEVVDRLLPGSIWKEPGDWTMGVAKNERRYYYHWKPTTDPAIAQIFVAANALNGSTGYVSLEYYGSSYQECDADVKQQEAGVL